MPVVPPNSQRRGYQVVRFWNNDVIDNLAGVLESSTDHWR
ncbi:MAG: DUF559 domain-containing protein [Alphaproteobacteria bacterium]